MSLADRTQELMASRVESRRTQVDEFLAALDTTRRTGGYGSMLVIAQQLQSALYFLRDAESELAGYKMRLEEEREDPGEDPG